MCITCQAAVEETAAATHPERPAEEDLLAPPSARTWMGPSGPAGLDGDDSGQALARFGSGATPGDVPGSACPEIMEGEFERRGAVADVGPIDPSPIIAPCPPGTELEPHRY